MTANGDTGLEGETTSGRPNSSTARSAALGVFLAAGLMSAAWIAVHGYALVGGFLAVAVMTGFVAAGAKPASTTAQDGDET